MPSSKRRPGLWPGAEFLTGMFVGWAAQQLYYHHWAWGLIFLAVALVIDTLAAFFILPRL